MSADGPGADPNGLGRASDSPDEQVHSQLVEALVHLLIEKGVLTRNDALSIVQTVADVQSGKAVEDTDAGSQTQAAITMLKRLYSSFEALADRTGTVVADADNVHQLRPPIYGDPPEFPRDE